MDHFPFDILLVADYIQRTVNSDRDLTNEAIQ